MTGTKLPYLRELVRHVPPGARLLDYGCGIGSDGLMLLEAGYRVEFADFDNPSTEYLRWRLEQRGLERAVHDLDKDVPDGFDAAYAFDVIEHVRDPWAFLGEMEKRAALVEVNLLEFGEHEQDLHYELPIPEILRHAADRGLEHYRIHYGSSHLILYRPKPAPAAAAPHQPAEARGGACPPARSPLDAVRVLHVGSGFRPWRRGGLVAYVEDLAGEQLRRGHEVSYFFSGRQYPLARGPRLRRWERDGLAMREVVNSPLYDHGRQPELEVAEPRIERMLADVLAERRPDARPRAGARRPAVRRCST